MFEVIAFYLFGALTISMFLIVVSTKNILYSMSALAAGMIFISAFFFLLDAEFLGVVQIVVYTGAVMALYAFGMMFFDSTKSVKESVENPRAVFVLSGMIALILVLMLGAPIIGANIEATQPIPQNVGNTQAVGLVLFTKYLIPFEVAALMLLVAMIAGIILAGKKMDHSLTLMCEEDAQITDREYSSSSAIKKKGVHS
jgi:NADH-quinone oxidoreductase subunit J